MTRISGSVPDARSTTRPRVAELRLGVVDRLANRRVRGRVDRLADLHVDEHLRELVHAGRELAERQARTLHDGEHLQRRHETVARRRAIEAEQMARRLAAENPAVLLEHLENVPVADFRAKELDPALPQRELETEVRHDRADDRAASVFDSSRSHASTYSS